MEAINPYIGFNGKCREAMTFYQRVLGGELELQDVKNSPAEEFREGTKDAVLHAELIINGHQVLMASDMVDQTGFVKGTNIALAMACSDVDEINKIFSKLSEGGKVLEDIKQQPWGALFGSLQDQFGIKWMLNCNQ